MRFAVKDEKPFLISGGKAYPVELTENHGVKISVNHGEATDLVGYLSLEEVIAKYKKMQLEVITQDTEILGVHAYELISPKTKINGNGEVVGTLFKAKVEQYDPNNSAEQKGYFFPVKLTKTGKTITTVKNGVTKTSTFPDDSMLLAKIENGKTTLKIEVDDEELVTLKFDKTVFSGKYSPRASRPLSARRSRKITKE